MVRCSAGRGPIGKPTESCMVFFFFQAEDGIRDKLVTGVQTCALPICGRGSSDRAAGTACMISALTPTSASMSGVRSHSIYQGKRALERRMRSSPNTTAPRSEERRVGKECRFTGARGEENSTHVENVAV